MAWDLFISHASEDKETIARPLAERLRSAGLRVWLDEAELCLGDSLRSKIDQGLAQSRYGVVVLSPAFFAKEWTQRELNGLATRDSVSQKVLLPIWHGIDHEFIAARSPMLADKLAVSTEQGLDQVVAQILRAVNTPTAVTDERRKIVEGRSESVGSAGTEIQGGPSARTQSEMALVREKRDARTFARWLPIKFRQLQGRRWILIALTTLILGYFVLPRILVEGHWDRVDAWGSPYGAQPVWALVRPVPGNQTLTLPLVDGRVFTPQDYGSGYAILDDELAKRLFNGNALNEYVRFSRDPRYHDGWLLVIGVVKGSTRWPELYITYKDWDEPLNSSRHVKG